MNERRILFIKSAPAVPVQGADISMFERMALLQPAGWSGAAVAAAHTGQRAGLIKVLQHLGIEVDQSSQAEIRYTYQTIRCVIVFDPDPQVLNSLTTQAWRGIENIIGQFSPAVILANLRDIRLGELFASGSERLPPAVFYLTEDEFPRRNNAGAELFEAHLKVVRHLVVASQYLAASFDAEWGVRPEVFLNTINTDRFRQVREPGEFITLVHPYAHKGLDFVLQLAGERPADSFAIVAGAGIEYTARKTDILSRRNVKLLEFTSDPQRIYEQSRIVLVPSLWQEAFSRVVIEACCCGVPVIVSRSGGLAETCGEGGLCLAVSRNDANGNFVTGEWNAALDRLKNGAEYSEACVRASSRATRYRRELQAELPRIAAFFEKVAGPASGEAR